MVHGVKVVYGVRVSGERTSFLSRLSQEIKLTTEVWLCDSTQVPIQPYRTVPYAVLTSCELLYPAPVEMNLAVK